MTGMIIVDDELLIRQGLQSIAWSDYGIELRGIAANGREALALIEATFPEILLTDIRMPGMDGLKLVNAAKEIIPEIKAILLTGYQDFNKRRRGMNCCPQRHFTRQYLILPNICTII